MSMAGAVGEYISHMCIVPAYDTYEIALVPPLSSLSVTSMHTLLHHVLLSMLHAPETEI